VSRPAAIVTTICLALAIGSAPARAAAGADSVATPPPRAAASPHDVARSPDTTGPGRWFYSGLPYGSEALIHPLRLVFNGGFGALQFDNRSNRLGEVGFRRGWTRLRDDLRAPGRTIAVEGWGDFFTSEMLPVAVNRKHAQYWPNYTLHLIGGGMSSVMMREWFQQHGSRHPALAAGLTMTTYYVLNETVEAGGRNGPSTDAIADLLVFDPAGAWLFSHEGVAGFFSRRMHLRDWSSQPAIDPATGAVENNGQNFSIKVAIPRSEHWSVFYYFGNHGEAGFSYRRSNGSAFSAGAGMSARELIDLGRGSQTAALVPSGGVFYDRNGSLLVSVTTAKNSRYGLRVNAYPGWIRVRGLTAGLFLLQVRGGGAVAGIHLLQAPVGLAGRL